ncbi:MAG TPA: hypothetical protein VJ436_14835, partial [Anaerolineales bacterium]|nr:hypothetical protein [Anaerolineales bacterium]
MLQFVPWRAWAWETLRAGQLPLWNPLVGMGAPLVANYQSGLFYPPNWLYFGLAALGGTPALAWGQGWLAAAHLAWAGIGMALLVRRLGLGRFSQTIGGLAFGLSGYLVGRVGFLSINAAAAWTPWILLTLTPGPLLVGEKRGGEEGGETRISFLLLAVCAGMLLLAGHAQTAWYTLVLAAAWSAGLVWIGSAHSQGWQARLLGIARAWLRLGAGVSAGALLAAVQLLPTAEYWLQSQRASAVDIDLAMTYSFWPWRLLTFFAPGLFGSPVSGDYRAYGNYWEDAVYLGLLPVILAVAAVFSAAIAALRQRKGASPTWQIGTRRRLAGFLAGLILAALILALGKNTPVFPWLYHHAPTFALFQAPTRFMLWAVFGLALLAALGAQAWQRPQGRALYWTRLGTAGAVAVALGAGLAWWAIGRMPSEVNPASIRALAAVGGFGLAAGALALT